MNRFPRLLVVPIAGMVAAALVYLGLMVLAGEDPQGPHDGLVRGGDLLAFWDGGAILAAGTPDLLYDRSEARRHERRVFTERRRAYRLAYPPPVYQVSARLVPLGYFRAVRLAMLLLALGAVLGCAALARAAPGDFGPTDRWILAGLLWASPAGIALIATGQVTGAWMASIGLGVALCLKRRDLAGGLLLGVCCAKPSLAPPVLAMLLLAGRWRAVAGFAIGGAGLLGLSLLADGAAPWAAWLSMLEGTDDFARRMWNYPHRQLTLRTLLALPARGHEVAATLGLAGVALGGALTLGVALASRGGDRDPARGLLRLGALLSAGLLATPHLFDYDTVLHGPALLGSAVWLAEGRSRWPRLGLALTAGAWLAPAFSPVAKATGISVGTLLIVAWVIWMARELRRG